MTGFSIISIYNTSMCLQVNTISPSHLFRLAYLKTLYRRKRDFNRAILCRKLQKFEQQSPRSGKVMEIGKSGMERGKKTGNTRESKDASFSPLFLCSVTAVVHEHSLGHALGLGRRGLRGTFNAIKQRKENLPEECMPMERTYER